MDPYNSPFETVDPAAMDPNALNGVPQPGAGNTIGMMPQQAPEGRGWADKMKEALMLAATVTPIGKMMGSKLGRLALGGGAAAGATALMTDPAQAAGAGGTGDPMLDALQSQLSIKQQQYQDEINGKGGRHKGDGPNAAGYASEIKALLGQIKQRQQEIHDQSLIETPAQKLKREQDEANLKATEQARADKHAEDNRGRFLEGAAGGALAGGALSIAGGMLTRGRFNRFQQVADDLNNLTQSTRKGTFAGKGTADEVAGLVDEANTLRGQPKSFGENPTKFGNTYSGKGVEDIVDGGAAPPQGPFARMKNKISGTPAPASAEAQAAGKTVMDSRKASGPDLGENFDNPYDFGKAEWAVPAIGAVDYGVMKTIGATKDNEEDKRAYDDMANFGLGFGAGAKGVRMATKPFTTLAARGAKVAPVNAAKNKLQRELADAGAAKAAPQPKNPSAPPGGSGTGPAGGVKAPPGKGGGLAIADLHARSKASAPARSAFHADPANKNMMDAIGVIQGRGARVTTDTVMRELKAKLGRKVDGVPINRKQIGRWLSRHGYLDN